MTERQRERDMLFSKKSARESVGLRRGEYYLKVKERREQQCAATARAQMMENAAAERRANMSVEEAAAEVSYAYDEIAEFERAQVRPFSCMSLC